MWYSSCRKRGTETITLNEPIGRPLVAQIQEGRAAKRLGLSRDMNPYRRHIDKLAAQNIDVPSVHWEHMRDWDSGWLDA